MPSLSVAELAGLVGGEVEGDGSRVLTGIAPAFEAGPGDLTFVTGERYRRAVEQSQAAAVLLPPDLDIEGAVTIVRVPDPELALIAALLHFHPAAPERPGVAPTVKLGHSVRLEPEVEIGEYVIIHDGARIGRRTSIGPFTVIGRDARIGEDCLIAHGCSVSDRVRLGDRVQLHPGVRVGTDGFGYARGEQGAVKIPQVGGCRIGDDVEIGANSTVDCGSLSDTVVGARTKIDNLVHIGHNAEIGEDCMIVAQVGIAGSAKICAGVAMGGQSGVSGHVEIGPGVKISARAGVIGDIPAGSTYSGYPARPHREAMRASAALFRLPRLLARIARLERRLGLAEPHGPAADRNATDEGETTG